MINLSSLSTQTDVSINTGLSTGKKNPETTQAATLKIDKPVVKEGDVKVSISPEGLQKSKSQNVNSNKDIDDSGLPDQAKKLLKTIRELQKKIEEKQAEIQKVMNDTSVSAESRQEKLKSLQTALSTLTASLRDANSSLEKLNKNGTLSPDQSNQASLLMMKKG